MDLALLASADAIIIALVQICKNAGFPSKYAGLLAVLMGLMAAFGVMLQIGSTDYFGAVKLGIMLGLTAAGAYSGGKAVIKQK